MPRDTAWVEEMVADLQQPSTDELRQVDFAEAGLCDLPQFEPKAPPKFENITKLHLLLKVACDDFASVLLDPRYRIAVGSEWHTPEAGTFFDRCGVCVAGAVIARSFKKSRTVELWPEDYALETANRLHAIDELRLGDVSAALDLINPDASAQAHRAAEDLTDFWADWLDNICDASNRVDGFLLLLELRRMQEQLKEANL